MMYEISHDERGKEFILLFDGFKAILSYVLAEVDTIDFISTKVPFQLRKKGIGKALVEAGIKYAAERNLKIVASCPFVADQIDKNSEVES